MSNKSQTSIGLLDSSITVSASWQRVCAEDYGRASLNLMNVGANNMGIYFAPIGNNGATPAPTGIGSAGVYTIVPTGSFEPDGGWVPANEVWVIGTASDKLTCSVSKPVGAGA